MEKFSKIERFVAGEYYIIISNSLFDGLKDSTLDGTSIYIDLAGSSTYISHSVISNNVYKDGAIFASNANTVSIECVVQHDNSGNRGTFYLDALLYELLNTYVNCSSERSVFSDGHGTMGSGRINYHFNYNNISESQCRLYSPWHFVYQTKSEIIKYSQMIDTTSTSVISWNAIGTLFSIQYFVFKNCTATKLNDLIYDSSIGIGGKIIYNDCTFFLNHSMVVGYDCTFSGCYSDGSIEGNYILTVTDTILDLMYPATTPCYFFKSYCPLTESKLRSVTPFVIISFAIINE